MLTVTVIPVVLDSKWKKNGTNFVRLRFTLRRESKLIKTNIVVRKEHMGTGGRIKDLSVKARIDELVLATEKKLSLLSSEALSVMTLDDVVSYLTAPTAESFKLDFIAFAKEVIAGKTGQSQKTYTSALHAFEAFVKKESFDISRVTSTFLRAWEAWLVNKYGNGARAVSAYTACISLIHHKARLHYNDDEFGNVLIRNPYQFYHPPKQKPAKRRALKAEVIQQMIDLRPTLRGRERLGVDVFLISFALMGMNSPDLYSCKEEQEGVLHYFRVKTRLRRDDDAEMFVRMEPVVSGIFAEYRSDNTDVAFSFASRYSTYNTLTENVNKGLAQFCKRIGRPKITLYWARHSWASIAYNDVGIDKGIVNDCLCHVDRAMKVTDEYIQKDWTVLWDANRKVLESFNWGDSE